MAFAIASKIEEETVGLDEIDLTEVIDFIKFLKAKHQNKVIDVSENRTMAFNNLMKYKGTLKRNIDYKAELMEALDEKYTSAN